MEKKRIYAIYKIHNLESIGKGSIKACIDLCLEDHPIFDEKRADFMKAYEKEIVTIDKAKQLAEENPELMEALEEILQYN